MAEWFAAGGARLVICSRTGEQLAPVAQELRDRFGVPVVADVCDISDPDQVDALVATATETFGGIDVAVANAAILGPVGPLVGTTPARWRSRPAP